MSTDIAQHRSIAHGEQLARQARRDPDQVALSFEGVDLTYVELDRRVNRLARTLQRCGVSRGDRVAVLMYNRTEVIESYFAAVRLGAIAVPVNFRLVAPEVRYILENSGAKVLLVDAPMAPVANELSDMTLDAVLVTGGAAATVGEHALDYENSLDSDDSPVEVVVADADPAFLMYTSGTTGRPKGAVLTHQNLTMNSVNCVLAQGIRTEGEVWYSGLPLFHIGGLNGILMYLTVGGRSIIAPSGNFDASATIDIIEREKVTSCYFVPTQWKEICAVPGVADRNLALRRISWGASVAPPSVLQAMADTFPNLPTFNMFGQTEMSSVTCVLRGEDAIRKMGSVGKPIVNVEARLVDDHGVPVPVGEVGEIVYRGPTVMKEYWNNPTATAEAFAGGWFHSGDLCVMDDEGFIRVVDRAKDMIISGGENIYCAEVEAVIDQHPKVAEIALVGAPHPRWVETPIAVIVPTDPSDPPTEDEIITFCRERLASYKKPTGVIVVDQLPRTATGKIQKFVLRDSVVAH
ncbi:long-chain-fatty-acid--CoA ligase [Gordonia sp. SID5947]|uniref:long-chain-fatty-acid--CoA ligase n=1 Tax=Gordonia sp. SID5947 TaxID=2690315 RepID=UPI001370F006|nr:long-chain-fatty-acid--CoA ligase [Gordonia sp. SID5947]MYR07872.1 long-chain-fatty-acid--CoA ligase [Gordonia sp. SID5947]